MEIMFIAFKVILATIVTMLTLWVCGNIVIFTVKDLWRRFKC